MNPSSDSNDLLDDVLAESVPSDFSTALLDETLRLARRRRRWRAARPAAAVVVLLVVLGTSVWRGSISRGIISRPPAIGYEMVRTQMLPVDAIVSTLPFHPEWTVATAASVDIVRTVPAMNSLRFLSDDELLALAAPRLPALVRTGTHSQELIFLVPGEPKPGRIN